MISRNSKIILILLAGIVCSAAHDPVPARAAKSSKKTRTVATAQHIVIGRGALRNELGQCERELPQFVKSLKAAGLSVTEQPVCIPHTPGLETHVPSFKANAQSDMAVELTIGGRFSSQSLCELQAQRMAQDLPKTNRVIESACSAIPGAHSLFQPSVAYVKSS